jgi:hypothetical protein
VDIKEKVAQSKLREAEARISTQKIRRDAAYASLVRAQQRGASPDARQRLAALYDRAEERLEDAENEARELRRKSMGLTPTVSGRIGFGPHVTRWLSSNINAYPSANALAAGAAETFDLPLDAELRSAALMAWRS